MQATTAPLALIGVQFLVPLVIVDGTASKSRHPWVFCEVLSTMSVQSWHSSHLRHRRTRYISFIVSWQLSIHCAERTTAATRAAAPLGRALCRSRVTTIDLMSCIFLLNSRKLLDLHATRARLAIACTCFPVPAGRNTFACMQRYP